MYLKNKNTFALPIRQKASKTGNKWAGVAELVDVLDLGSSAARRGGSIPSARTINKGMTGRQDSYLDKKNELLRSKTRQMPSGLSFEGIFVFLF